MSQRILIGVAWPYANGSLHMGHIAGCYLSADIFARFHRMNGNQVLMVSGSDQHGTPITIRAEQENVSPKDIVSKYHKEFLTPKFLGLEWWSHKNGYENMDNTEETRNEDTGEVIWSRTDWEYVDDTYNHYINDKDYYPYPATLKKMNLLWKKYYITEKVGDSY